MSEERASSANGSTIGDNARALVMVAAIVFVLASLLMPQLVWPFFIAFGITSALIWSLTKTKIEVGTSASQALDVDQRNKEKTEEMLEALQYPAFIIDQNANLRQANYQSKQAFGDISEGDRIFSRFRQPELRRLIEQTLASAKSGKIDYHEAGSGDRWYNVEISAIPWASGEKPNFLLGFHDQTEAKRTEQMRSDFIANASHELRTPLASLLGYIETIKGPARDDAKAIDKFTDVMLEQAQRMTRLVNDLLSLSRIEMKAHMRPEDEVDLGEILSSVASSLDGMAKQMGIEIEFNRPKGIKVLGDRDELLEVFENLVENACKYGQDGKKVILSVDTDENSADVSVRDFGPGIAVEHQHRITERFYRVDVARSREKQGTGLGLAIVKHILNRHGTRLMVKSEPGKGAEFTVKLALSTKMHIQNNVVKT